MLTRPTARLLSAVHNGRRDSVNVISIADLITRFRAEIIAKNATERLGKRPIMNAYRHKRVSILLMERLQRLVSLRTVRATVPGKLFNEHLTINILRIYIGKINHNILILNNLINIAFDFVATGEQKANHANQSNNA